MNMPNTAEWDNLSLFDEPNQEDLDMPMTEIERSELAGYEQVIEQGLQTFYDVGTALLAIRDKRLYRSEFRNFEDYCRDRWNMSKRHANRLIMASSIIDNLGPLGPVSSPVSERETRPLTPLSPEQQREAWQRVVDTAPNGNITSSHVQRVVDDMLGKSPERPTPPNVDAETGEILDAQTELDDYYEPTEPRKTASELRKEYIAAARREGIKPDINPAQSALLNEARLFEHVPAAKEFVAEANRMIIRWQKEFPVAVDIGKFSPEAERYIANRLDILIDILSKRRDELRNADND